MRNKLCAVGKMFIEDERYYLSRYETTDWELYLLLWNETFEDTLVVLDETFKRKSWENVFSDETKIKFKIVDKMKKDYVGEVSIINLNDRQPELGIQLLRKYQGVGIGTRVMKMFANELKKTLHIEEFLVRIFSDTIASQRMFEKMGAVRIGEQGKEQAEFMRKLMLQMGKQHFEKIIGQDFEKTQRYIICYELKV